jgi:hypothetical protein
MTTFAGSVPSSWPTIERVSIVRVSAVLTTRAVAPRLAAAARASPTRFEAPTAGIPRPSGVRSVARSAMPAFAPV